jgi:hypothetical protein
MCHYVGLSIKSPAVSFRYTSRTPAEPLAADAPFPCSTLSHSTVFFSAIPLFGPRSHQAEIHSNPKLD